MVSPLLPPLPVVEVDVVAVVVVLVEVLVLDAPPKPLLLVLEEVPLLVVALEELPVVAPPAPAAVDVPVVVEVPVASPSVVEALYTGGSRSLPHAGASMALNEHSTQAPVLFRAEDEVAFRWLIGITPPLGLADF